MGATKGQKIFDGAILTARYFFDVLNAEYAGDLLIKGVDVGGDILKQPEVLKQAFEAGGKLVRDGREGDEDAKRTVGKSEKVG